MITYRVEPNNITTVKSSDRDAQILELGTATNIMEIINKQGAVYILTNPAKELVYKLLHQHHTYLLGLVGEREL